MTKPFKVWTADEIYKPLYESLIHKKAYLLPASFIATEDVIEELLDLQVHTTDINAENGIHNLKIHLEATLKQLQEKPRSEDDE
jgi:hypothetical protein